MKIGFDILGGDFAPTNCLEGLIMAAEDLPAGVTVVLIGNSDTAKTYLQSKGVDPNKFEYVHTTENIEMGEHPTKAFSQNPKTPKPQNPSDLKCLISEFFLYS